jgi:hypothetical protein
MWIRLITVWWHAWHSLFGFTVLNLISCHCLGIHTWVLDRLSMNCWPSRHRELLLANCINASSYTLSECPSGTTPMLQARTISSQRRSSRPNRRATAPLASPSASSLFALAPPRVHRARSRESTEPQGQDRTFTDAVAGLHMGEHSLRVHGPPGVAVCKSALNGKAAPLFLESLGKIRTGRR